MKVSKVDHYKTGIDKKDIESGIIYQHPSKNNKGAEDIRNRVEKLNSKAQRLYRLLSPLDEKKDYAKEKTYKTINSYFRFVFINNINDVDRIIASVNSYSFRNYKSIKNSDKIAEIIIEGLLRNSVRKTVKVNGEEVECVEIAKELAKASVNEPKYVSIINSLGEDRIRALAEVIKEDFNKEKQINNIVKSITNQSVPVAIQGDKLVLSSSLNKKKEYIFEFVKEYAEANQKKQDNLLVHFRYLIILYIFGEDKANGFKDDLGVWTFGSVIQEFGDDKISDELCILIQERDALQSKDKAGIKRCNDRIKISLRNLQVELYNKAKKEPCLSENDIKWLSYISDSMKKIIVGQKEEHKASIDRLNCGYLCKTIWDQWLAYIADKYIELGKGVYNFSLTNLDDIKKGNDICFGRIDERYKNGISSFDYELLSARDSLKRSMSEYASFAINNFSNSILSDEEREKIGDVLFAEDNLNYYHDSRRRLLRFFCGESSWDTDELSALNQDQMIKCFREMIKIARNSSFHFVSDSSKGNDLIVIESICNHEVNKSGYIYRKKYYSNNTLKFYKDLDINAIMTKLYSKQKPEISQIPSFNKVLSRKEFDNFVNGFVEKNTLMSFRKTNIYEQFMNSLYFVLKEIYYYDFVRKNNKELYEDFFRALDKVGKLKGSNKEAIRDFSVRIKLLKMNNFDFSGACQYIMTEYNQQNSDMKKHASARVIEKNGKNGKQKKTVENKDNQKYKHFRTLLYLTLREMFKNYIERENDFSFLKRPSDRSEIFELISEDEFVSSWKTDSWSAMKEIIITDNNMCAWYITSHFLNQKQLNHLIGHIKTFIEYKKSIKNRAKATGNEISIDKNETKEYKKLLSVLEFVKLFCGQISGKFSDYYGGDDDEAIKEYNKSVRAFVDIGDKDNLRDFCNCTINKKPIGTYYDAKKPIINRGVIYASMYGSDNVISNIYDRVTIDDFKEKEELEKKLKNVFESGEYNQDIDYKNYRRYQNLKMRIELTDVMKLSELLNEFYGKLNSFIYLRERDLMYMQLGFWYIKLFHTDSITAESSLRKLTGSVDVKDGAILYQIAALYSYGLNVYHLEDDGLVKNKYCKNGKKSTSGKIKEFFRYASSEDYANGLCFFEDINKHSFIIDYRNDIEHFAYYTKQNKSILELYSIIYDDFFSYSTKLKKSVSYIIPNILLGSFINSKLIFEKTVRDYGDKKLNSTMISIKGSETDYFTYKTKTEEKVKVEEDESETTDQVSIDDLAAKMMGGANKEKKKDNKPKKNNKRLPKDTKVPAVSENYIREVVALLSYKN